MDTVLELKTYTNAELAEWFGIKAESFKATRKRKLEELKEYADFTVGRGKVTITNIKQPYYTKGSPSAKKIYKEFFNLWNADGYDTCANVGKKAKAKYPEEVTVCDRTAAYYTLIARNDYVGKPFSGGGKKGYCEYETCKKQGDRYVPFTEEEKAINRKLLTRYFSTSSEKAIYVSEMIRSGEIDKSEAWDEYSRMIDFEGNYSSYMAELTAAIGAVVIHKTTHIYRSAWERTEDELNK